MNGMQFFPFFFFLYVRDNRHLGVFFLDPFVLE